MVLVLVPKDNEILIKCRYTLLQKKKNFWLFYSLYHGVFTSGPNFFLRGWKFAPSKTIFYIRILFLMPDPVFWIRIFLGIILPDPDPHLGPAAQDPDPYPFQPNVKLTIFFSDSFKILSKMLKTTKPTTLTRMIQQSRLACFYNFCLITTRSRIRIRV